MRFSLFAIIILFFFFTSSYAKEHKNILLLSSYHQFLPWTSSHLKGVEEYIKKQDEYTINLFQEYMEILRLRDNFDEKLWVSYLEKKYKNIRIDGLIVDTALATDFAVNNIENIFGKIPMVMFSNKHDIKSYNDNKLIFHAKLNSAIENTIKIAIKQNPNAKKFVLIVNNEKSSINILNAFKNKLKIFPSYEFEILREDSVLQYLEKIKKLDSKSILFYSLIKKDKKGRALVPKEVLSEFSQVAKIPIYTFYSSLLDSGSIGGDVVDAKIIGHSMLEAIFDYIKNSKFKNSYLANSTIIDYEVLKRFNIKEKTLPKKTIFLNKKLTFMQIYTKEIFVASLILFSLVLILLYIHFKNVQLKKSKDKISKMNKIIHNKNRQLLNAQLIAKIGSWSYDIVNNTLIWSDETYKIFEIERNSMGDSYEDFLKAIHPEDREMVANTYKTSIEKKTPYRIKHRLLMKDGRVKWVVEDCRTEFSKDGKAIISIGIIQDITKEHENDEKIHEQEQQLYESQKLAAMGEMIGNIAHQWRQPLNAISVSASGMNLKYEMGILTKEDLNEFYKAIINNTDFLSRTIDTFRNFIKEEKVYKEVVLQDRIEKSLEIINIVLRNKHIKLIDEIDYSKPIKLKLIVGELSQVLLNLINNSKDALEEKNIEEPWIKLMLEKYEDKAVIIVEDNAKGISEDVLPHIFEPYFTTKHQSQGTGLGLHMSKEIMEKHLNGKIYAKNTKEGVKFFVELPL